MEELQAIYNNYYGNNEGSDYFKDNKILRDNNSNIPVLKKEALFFTCYDDSVYESVLDDMKKEYSKYMKESKPWHFG